MDTPLDTATSRREHAYQALKQGIESRLLYFPDENHWVLKPRNSLQWHAVVLDWLDAHLRQ